MSIEGEVQVDPCADVRAQLRLERARGIVACRAAEYGRYTREAETCDKHFNQEVRDAATNRGRSAVCAATWMRSAIRYERWADECVARAKRAVDDTGGVDVWGAEANEIWHRHSDTLHGLFAPYLFARRVTR